MRYYELMIVVSPQVDDEGLSATLDRMNGYVTQRGGSVVRQERWGQLRRLAYPIRNYNEGNYVLTHLEMDPQDTKALEASLMLSEDVLRHLLVKIEAIPPARAEQAPRPQAAEAVSTEGLTEVGEEVSQEAPVAVVEEEPQATAEAQAAVAEEPTAEASAHSRSPWVSGRRDGRGRAVTP